MKIIVPKILIVFFIFNISCGSDDSHNESSEPQENDIPPNAEENPSEVENQNVLAFPSAEGFGRYTSGGRGGKVYKVTKLDDDGSIGTLRYAIEQTGARYVIFETGGTIFLNSELKINNPHLTIAGQTAPGGGITIGGYPVTLNADNIIIRYVRFRMSDINNAEGDALGARFHENLIIDHCSMSWSTDECVSIYNNENTTVQWCVIGESLRNSVHGKGSHGYGGIWGGKNASFHHNLLAHHDSRNPRLGEYAGAAFALTDKVDLRNNVIYNWQGNSTYGGEAMNVNIVNCYYKPGPSTTKEKRIVAIDKNLDENTEVYDVWGKFYINGNFVEGSPEVTNNNWDFGVYNQIHSKYGELTQEDKDAMKINQPHDINGNVTTHDPQVAYNNVLQFAGNSLVRDEVDEHIINDVANASYTYEGSNGSTNGIIDTQSDVGGFPSLEQGNPKTDTDNDGMPDDWEKAQGLDKNIANATQHDLNNSYDNLEVYLNSLVAQISAQQNQ